MDDITMEAATTGSEIEACIRLFREICNQEVIPWNGSTVRIPKNKQKDFTAQITVAVVVP